MTCRSQPWQDASWAGVIASTASWHAEVWRRYGSPRTRCSRGGVRANPFFPRPQLAVDDALRVRFRNEAIAAAKLTHPGIVATYDTGDDDGTAYIVMELVEGTTLRRVIDERERLPVRDAVDISSQVADALEHA